MKKVTIMLLAISFLLIISNVNAQNINWASLQKTQRHIININAGLDYGLTYGVGYGYQLKTKLPIIINGEYSFPSGNKIFDDYKSKIGGTIRLAKISNFQFSAKLHGVFRRYENTLTRLVNFGSDMSAAAGYYKRKWHVAGEFGFDKAIVTNFKHSQIYKDNFPLVKDGWYEPSTGGNFYYGIQTGISFKQHDIYLKAGRVLTQDFKTKPLVPYYAQIGINAKLK
jgi:hypothetical protein